MHTFSPCKMHVVIDYALSLFWHNIYVARTESQLLIPIE